MQTHVEGNFSADVEHGQDKEEDWNDRETGEMPDLAME